MDDEIVVSIPANAADVELKVTIDKVTGAHKLLTNNEVLVTSVYEILENIPDNFIKLVTLTFKFDPASLNKTNQWLFSTMMKRRIAGWKLLVAK